MFGGVGERGREDVTSLAHSTMVRISLRHSGQNVGKKGRTICVLEFFLVQLQIFNQFLVIGDFVVLRGQCYKTFFVRNLRIFVIS